MSDASDEVAEAGDREGPPTGADASGDEDIEALRQQVEEKYDFENFGPRDMAEMSPEEWDAAFDPDTWITGEELLDRVEADLKHRVATRDVFARVERFDDLIIAYSDSGYAAVYEDGSVEGSGTVLRDVKPTVALCSMDSYEVPEMPEGEVLPQPQEIPESSDALGNTVLQVVAGVQVLAGLVMLAAWALYSLGVLSRPGTNQQELNLWLLVVAGLGFLGIGIFLFVMVANARLSDKFRAEEFRNRLRAIGLEDGERPDFLNELDGVEGDLPDELLPAEGDGGGKAASEPDGEGDGADDERASSGSA
ncbi:MULTISPECIES: DUF7319 domain-containing protein [Salinibaculum]|uniref:DUF7319 domain-containing protein n=1 Tax=Salinibaculum TaxID=2732368 RepID=UPI0030CFBBFF